MAMIICPECGKKISSHATVCVNCGLSLNKLYICPECGNVGLNTKSICENCGCPIQTSIESVKKEESKTITDEQYMKITEKILKKVLARSGIESSWDIYNGNGFPIEEQKKINIARLAFKVPHDEKIFFMCNGNVLGFNTNSKGFALSSRGLYFKDKDKKVGLIHTHELIDFPIDSSWAGFLKIGNFEFNIGIDREKIEVMLIDLQREISNYI